MVKKLYTEASVQDIADAIREKNGEETQYKTSEMAPAILALGSAREVLNGIIEQYKATASTISPDTFVEFVKGETFNRIADTKDITNASGSDSVVATTHVIRKFAEYSETRQATDDDVLVLYRVGDYVYGAVCRFANDILTIGQPVQVTTIAGSWIGLTVGFLSAGEVAGVLNNKVYIFHSSSSNILGGLFCEVSGLTITPGVDTNFSNISAGQYPIQSVVLANGTAIFVSYGVNDGGTDKLMGVIIETSNNTFSVLTSPTVLATGAGVAREHARLPAFASSANGYLVAHPSGGSEHNYLSAVAVRIAYITTGGGHWEINRGDDQLLIETDGAGEHLIQHTLPPQPFTMIFHSSGRGTQYVNIVGVEVDSGEGFHITITASDRTMIQATDAAQGCAMDIRELWEHYVYQDEVYTQTRQNLLFVYRDGNTYRYVEHILSYDSRETPSWNWTLGQALPLSSTAQAQNYVCTIAYTGYEFSASYGEGETDLIYTSSMWGVLATYSYGSGVRGSVITYEQTVQPSIDKIEGVTQTECSVETAGNVWVLNEE